MYSSGENNLKQWLIDNNIQFECEKSFNNLKYKSYLRYDFYLPDYNMLIECQGKQHYFSVNKQKLQKQLYKDKLKYDYAINNNYRYLLISYKHYNDMTLFLHDIIITDKNWQICKLL